MVEQLLGPVRDCWTYSSLGEVCRLAGGGIQTGPFGSQLHAADYVPVGIPSIMPQNIGDNQIIETDIARITKTDAERLSRYRVKAGDIIYSRRGDVERRALIREREDGWLCGTGCLRVRLGRGVADPAYAAYYLAHPAVREWIVRHAHGATMPNLNTSILSACPFVLPPIAEQRSIASILGVLDDKIDLNRRMNDTLEATARAIFKDWFVDFGPTRAKMDRRTPYLVPEIWALFPERLDGEGKPEEWRMESFLDHVDLISGGTPKTEETAYWNGPIAWASAKDVSQCGDAFLISTERCITERGLEESATRMIPKLSTVVVARGATTGRYCMFGRDMTMNQTCYALSSSGGHPFWTNCAFGSLVGALVHAAHGSVFDTITTKTIEGARLVIAPKKTLDGFENTVEALFTRVLKNIEESHTLAATRDLLLPKLMSGDIRVKDAEKLAETAL